MLKYSFSVILFVVSFAVKAQSKVETNENNSSQGEKILQAVEVAPPMTKEDSLVKKYLPPGTLLRTKDFEALIEDKKKKDRTKALEN